MKVLVADRLGAEGLALLRAQPGIELVAPEKQSPSELRAELADAVALIVRSGTQVTRELLEAAPLLRVVGRAGIGVDNIDVEAATERGVVVLNTPDANATTTAELAIAHLFSLSRRLPQADRSLREGEWARSRFVGTELTGKTLGVVGFGTIGRIVADRCLGLKMKVLAHDPYVTPELVRKVGAEPCELTELLTRSDFVSLHCPLTESTRNLIGAEALAGMKPGARLINCARGGLVDEKALLAALESGHLAGAALDVFEREPPEGSPLLAREDVVATPHLGASTSEAQAAVALAIARQVITFLETGEAVNALNLPRISAEEAGRAGPWAALARSLGRILSQLAPWPYEEVRLGLFGRVAELDPRPLSSEALAGILGARLEGPVNAVNAPFLARRQGMALRELRSEESSDYVSLLTLEGRSGEKRMKLAGTLLGERHPRLVRLGAFEIEAIPEGTLLITRHDDRPGVIGALGGLLGEAGVNISRMHVGLAPEGDEAMALLCVSGQVPEDILVRIRGLKAIHEVWHVAAG